MTAPVPAMASRAVTPRRPRAGIDGCVLSVRAWLLLAAGTAGGLVFTGVYLAEGATRAGYAALAQPVSALSLGPGGWVQQLNFIVFGVLAGLSAAGWRAALAPGRGAVAFPVLRAVAGVGLVMDGLFAQDPSGGYPPGARAAGCFVLAARFAAEPLWRRWAVPAAAAGVAIIVFIAAFGAAGGHGGLAGLWERAAGAATSALTVAVLARLAVLSRHGARARHLGPA